MPPPRALLPPPLLRFLPPVDLFFDLPRLPFGIFLKTTNSTRKEKTENAIVLSVSNSPTRCSFLGCQQQLTTTQEVFALVNVNPIIGRGHMSLLCLECVQKLLPQSDHNNETVWIQKLIMPEEKDCQERDMKRKRVLFK